LLALASICALGFMLCPYLDATFHGSILRTRSRRSGLSFAIGFLLFFFAMIVATRLYAPAILDVVAANPGIATSPQLAPWLIIAHMMLQLGFTIGAHQHALSALPRGRLSFEAALAIGLILGVLAFRGILPDLNAMASTELVYRCFMAFYGVAFPAYVWVCAWPAYSAATSPTRMQLTVCGVSILVALPFAWLGFFEGRTLYLFGALGAVLIARPIALLLTPRQAHAEPGSSEPHQR
jgi:hypothetical protein